MEKLEYGCAVYCDAADSRPIQGDGEEAGGLVGDLVAGTGGNSPDRGNGDGGGGSGSGRGWSGGIK